MGQGQISGDIMGLALSSEAESSRSQCVHQILLLTAHACIHFDCN